MRDYDMSGVLQERHWREAAEFVTRYDNLDEVLLVMFAITELIDKASTLQESINAVGVDAGFRKSVDRRLNEILSGQPPNIKNVSPDNE